MGRPHNAADYGTNGGVVLSRPNTAAARSATVLVTTTRYNSRGEADEVVDAKGTVNQSTFDDAERLVKLLENFVSGGTGSDQNRATDYGYNADGKVATLTARNNITGDQVTQYVYGTTLNNSDVASNELLRMQIYPGDSASSPDRLVLANNRQGQLKSKQDQTGSVHVIDYDLLGRQLHNRVASLGAGMDEAVRRVSATATRCGAWRKTSPVMTMRRWGAAAWSTTCRMRTTILGS